LEKTIKDTKDELSTQSEKMAEQKAEIALRDEKIDSLTRDLQAKKAELEAYMQVNKELILERCF
jgi:hypothetical protein